MQKHNAANVWIAARTKATTTARILLHSKLELHDSAVFFVVLDSRDARSAVARASLRECRVDRLAKRGARIWWHAAFAQRDLAVLAEEHERGQPADAIGLRKVIALHL